MHRFDIRVAKKRKEGKKITRQTMSKRRPNVVTRWWWKEITYLARAYSPISRPIPDCLYPPKGACAFKWLTQLTLKARKKV